MLLADIMPPGFCISRSSDDLIDPAVTVVGVLVATEGALHSSVDVVPFDG